jgi:molybdopterin synthase sulfur carrier subunit
MRAMNVNFYATLRQVTGRKSVEFDLADGATVGQLLKDVIRRFPGLEGELFDADGSLFGHVHVFVNGRDAPYLDDALDTVLGDSDTVDVFPAVAGG